MLVRPTFADHELSACGLYPVDEPDEVLIERLARRVKTGAVARDRGETVCLEHGQPIPGEAV